MTNATTGLEAIGTWLRTCGARRVFGDPLPGLGHVAVAAPPTAELLAAADGRLGPGPGVAWDAAGRTLLVTSRPGPVVRTHEVGGLAELPGAIGRAVSAMRRAPASTRISLSDGIDLEAVSPFTTRRTAATAYAVPSGAVLPATGKVVVLAGPGVVRAGAGAVEGLRALAAAGPLPVANTWGAKGVFTWDSPHHMGTCGLQARDFELLGFGQADLIVATGIDPAEATPAAFALAPVLHIDPAHLAWHVGELAGRTVAVENRLYATLAGVAQPGYADDRFPLHPARVVKAMRDTLPADGVVAADPGPAGLWVARTFPTSVLGSVVVPATAAAGIAAAIALCAALDGRPAVAVVHPTPGGTGPGPSVDEAGLGVGVGPGEAGLDDGTRAVIELARHLGRSLTVVAWGAEGVTSAADLDDALANAATADGVSVLGVPIDHEPTDGLLHAAGPLTAWQP